MVYIAAAFAGAHSVSILSSPAVQSFLSGRGLSVRVTDAGMLRNTITAGLLIGGEIVFHFLYEKFLAGKFPGKMEAI